jgi:hypothetical protein
MGLMSTPHTSNGYGALRDVPAPGKWFCARCETERGGVRRLNAIGATAVALTPPFIVGLYGTLLPALKTAFGSDPSATHADWSAWGATVCVAIAIARIVVSAIVGPGRNLICAACDQSELVPADSPKARRLRLEADAKLAELAAEVHAD